MKYTLKQEEDAKEYLRKRLDNESSMRKDVYDLLSYYIPLLIALIMQNATKEEIDALLEDLIAELVEDCDTLAVDEHTDESAAILAFIHGDVGGNTIDGRIRERVMTLFDEVSTIVAVGLILGMAQSMIVSSVMGSLETPWKNKTLEEFREKVAKGEIALPESLDIDERHYGKGVPVSSFVALTDITVYGVSAGWCVNDYLSHRDASGYYVFRGSSYPCEECDSHTGYHPATDTASLPLFHNHCKCYVVWV